MPAMGIKGAALASVCANIFVFLAALAILIFRDRLIQFQGHSVNKIIQSWKQILHVGFPAIASNLIAPVSSALVTALVASFGQSAVAAYGLAGRIEAFVIVILMALGGAMAPFVGQNFGAKKFERLREGFVFAARFMLVYSIFCILFLFYAADFLVGIFTSNEEVMRIAIIQLVYCPWGYGFLGLAAICNGSFNAFGKPMPAMTISISRTLMVYVPMAYWLASIYGIRGIFIAQVLSNILAGIVALFWYRSIFKQLRSEYSPA
jgi:Na+-driven multidrug efflux pump